MLWRQFSRGVLYNGIPKKFAKCTGKHLCQSLFFNKVTDLNFIKKETLARVWRCSFCEFCKICNNTVFREHLRWLMLLHDFDGLLEYHLIAGKNRLCWKMLKMGNPGNLGSSTKLPNFDNIWCKWTFNRHLNCPNRERYLWPCKLSLEEFFAKINNDFSH